MSFGSAGGASTTQEPTMSMITSSIDHEIAGGAFVSPTLRWEPCLEAGAADEHGLCAGCGWPPEEHAGIAGIAVTEGTEGAGGDTVRPNVVTMPVPERPRLRKAS